MTTSIKHRKVSAKADGADTTLVKPSDWNDTHKLETTGSSLVLGRDNSGAGDIQELAVDGAGSSDYTMITKFRVQQLIATAIAALPAQAVTTGDICASLAAVKAGWVLMNGQTLSKTNGESNHALFNLLWALNGNTWPVLPSRGANALADWDAFKTIAVPDARGCTVAMIDLSAGIAPLIAQLGIRYGQDKVALTVDEMPPHVHSQAGAATGIGGSGGGSTLQASPGTGNTGSTGGDPAAVPPNSVAKAHNNVQPTMGVNLFIKL